MLSKKTLTIIDWTAKIAVASIMILFGIDKIFPYMPHPVSSAEGIAFKEAMKKTGYLFYLVGVTETIAGILLLTNKFTKIGLLMMAPLVVNFLAYHIALEPQNIAGALAVSIGVFYMAWMRRNEFKPLFQA